MKILIFLLTIILSAYAVTFNCKFTDYSNLIYMPNLYSCEAPTLSNFEREILTAVYGSHEEGKTDADVGFLDIQNQSSLTFIPKEIQKFFPNLVAIRFMRTNIVSLKGDELGSFKDLEFFVISQNPNLERIPGNLFSSNPKIHSIFFSENNIKHIGASFFDGIEENLKFLWLKDNYCVDGGANYFTIISSIIEHVKNNCTDIEEEKLSTTLSTTTSNTEIPTTTEEICDICDLKEQNKNLIQKK